MRATSTLGDEVAVSGQSSLAVTGQIVLSAHIGGRRRGRLAGDAAPSMTWANYLNHGRHVMDQGAYEGEFPVDHQDAGFAIALTQVILSYASHALAAASAPS
jgi:hypothetical protein